MRVTVEKVVVLFVVGVFIVTSFGTLNETATPITREQAIGVSKRSEQVEKGLVTARGFIIEAHYYNASMLQHLKTVRSESWLSMMPEGHTAWEIIWWFGEAEGIGGYNAIVVIDAERAIIIAEPAGIRLL